MKILNKVTLIITTWLFVTSELPIKTAKFNKLNIIEYLFTLVFSSSKYNLSNTKAKINCISNWTIE